MSLTTQPNADIRPLRPDDGIANFTGSLTPQQVADIMASALKGTTYVPITDILLPTTYAVGIVIRSLVTGKETLITQPTFLEPTPDFSTTWMQNYLDHPVFYKCNLQTIPRLDNPLNHPQDLCTIATFPRTSRNDDALQAIAFAVYDTTCMFSAFPSRETDQVIVKITTPQIPLSYGGFKTVVSHQHRRFNALQHTFFRMAKNSGYIWTRPAFKGFKSAKPLSALARTLLYHENPDNKVMMDAESDIMELTFAFTVPATEKTAGSRVIPTVLKTLAWLLPGLNSEQTIYYDILQAHKFAYTFRLRNLAGWRILGAVNTAMYAAEDTDYCFSAFAPAYEHRGVVMMSNSILSVYPSISNNADAFVAKQLETVRELEAVCKAELVALLEKKSSGHTKKFIDSYRKKVQKFTSEENAKLSYEEWQHLLPCIGLDVIARYLETYVHSVSTSMRSLPSDGIMRRILDALQGKYQGNANNSSSSSSSHEFSNMELFSLLSVYFECCQSLAKTLLADTDLAITSKAELRTKLVDDAKASAVTISLPQALTFLRACIGAPPAKWPAFLYTSDSDDAPPIFEDAATVAMFIFAKARTFSDDFPLLYPRYLFDGDFSTLIDTSRRYNPTINNARAALIKTIPITQAADLADPLAYALFTGKKNLI